jgi:hypothetical protein
VSSKVLWTVPETHRQRVRVWVRRFFPEPVVTV